MTDRRKIQSLSVGLKNNNAGNIRKTNINWIGEVKPHESTSLIHEQFISSEYGLRALMKQIVSTIKRSSAAPIDFVKDYAGGSSPQILKNYADIITKFIAPEKTIETDRSGLIKAAKAIVYFENGNYSNYISNKEYSDAFDLIGSNPVTIKKGLNPVYFIVPILLILFLGFKK